MIAEQLTPVAMLVAGCNGWVAIRVVRKMIFEGVGLADGGGYTAIVLAAVVVHLAAVGVALR